MSTTRRFCCDDLLKFNNINLDVLTETYNMPFYLQYLTTWPEYFLMKEAPDGTPMGYIMGKAEGQKELWHGHVTAVTVAPEYRRLGVAKQLMDSLETVSEHVYNAFFVDLFVRVSNTLAINMYNAFGYSVYRRVIGYYSGEEDAFDMRKALPRDKAKKSVVPLSHPVMPEDLEWRQHNHDRNQPKLLSGRETSNTAEEERSSHNQKHGQGGDVEEAGLASATVRGKALESFASATSEKKPSASRESAEIPSRLVHVGWNSQPITAGLSSVTLPLGTRPRESLQQKTSDGDVIPSAAAGRLAHQALYLTSSGPNNDLLKMMTGEGAAGGFGEVTFWKTVCGQELALKTAKDTASGRRQQRREIEFLVDFKRLHSDAANIVRVVEARTVPFDMLLMRKESMTLTSMLESAASIDVGAVAKVLFGVLTAIDLLHESGFVQRDIKADNMLIGADGSGILADFGLCIAEADAGLPEFLGDGTVAYAAPEVAARLSGSTLCSELYSWFVVFVEAVMMRHPFGGEQLFDAKEDRLEYLAEQRENRIEDLKEVTGELERLLDDEEKADNTDEEEAGEVSLVEQRLQLQEELASVTAELAAVRRQEWRLGERNPREWRPTAGDKAVLASLGEPLSFFRKSKTRNEQREEMASGEAKANPSRLFEGDDWVEWLPGPSMADCKQGVRLAVDFVVEKGVFHPDPELRTQDVETARVLLTEAVTLYEQQRRREVDQDDGARGATRRDSGAGG
eukprot:g5090.t1